MSTAEKVLAAMQSYDLKSAGHNKYRSRSPYRSDSDSPSFSLEISDDEHGVWYDHVAERGGSLYTLASHLGIDTPTYIVTTKRSYSGRKDYALAHGIPDEVLEEAGWKETIYQNRPALEYHTATGKRWRFLDGNKPSYKSVTGYKPCWYGLDERLKSKLELEPLVIANGEISVISARYHGLNAACVTSGEKDLSPELVAQLKTFTQGLESLEIIIALDCDPKGVRVALQMKSTLEKAGFNSVRAVDLGLSDGGDLADFVMLHGKYPACWHALHDLPELQPVFTPQVIQRWQIFHASELQKIPAIQWLIPKEVPAKCLLVIYGPSGVGKSFKALDYALHIAQQKPVVYVAAEGASGYSGRIEAWMKHHNLGYEHLYMCMGAVSFMDSSDLAAFVTSIEQACNAPALVIVDTLARSMIGADENSTRDMGKFIDACEQIKHYFDCSVMLVHHTNKGGSAERGSNALRGAADMMIKLIDEDDLIRIECSKSKDSEKFEPYYMRLKPVEIGLTDDDGNSIMPPVIVHAEHHEQTSNDDLTIKQKTVLETLVLSIFEYGATVAELSEYLPDTSLRTLYKIIDALKNFGFVQQKAKREPYFITEDGLQKIGQLSGTYAQSVHTALYESASDKGTSQHESVSKGFTMGMTDMKGSSSPKQTPLMDMNQTKKNHYQWEDDA